MNLSQMLLTTPVDLLSRQQQLSKLKTRTYLPDEKLIQARIPVLLQHIANEPAGKLVSKAKLQNKLGLITGLNEAFAQALQLGLLYEKPVGNRIDFRRTNKEYTP